MSKNLTLSPAEFRNLVKRAHHADFDVASFGHAPAGSTVTFSKDNLIFQGRFLCAAHPDNAEASDGRERLVIHQPQGDSDQIARFTVSGLFSDEEGNTVSGDILSSNSVYAVLEVLELVGSEAPIDVAL